MALKQRIDGFMDCVNKDFPAMSVKQVRVAGDSKKCYDAVTTVFTADPSVVGVYNHSDAVCASAVTSALRSLGKLHAAGEPGHIVWTAIDGSPDGLKAIRDGYLDQTQSQPADLCAKYSVYWLAKAMKGEKVTTGPTDHNSEVKIADGTITDVLPATPVTRDNASDPALWGNASKGAK